MKLHNDLENFKELINSTSRYFNVSPGIIEKDYYVTLVLKELRNDIPNLLFKGGTSLSKCFKLIDRFSEDIDITLDENCQSQSKRRQLKYKIIEICNKLNLRLLKETETRSRRDYNCYIVDYGAQYNSPGVNPKLLIETLFINKAYPSELKSASSMIYDYLKKTNKESIIELYDLFPFDINVQSLERTLIDKVFAICDYRIDGRTERLSRHIYDLSRLVTVVKLDENLRKLMIRVREERKDGIKSYSAKENININELLQKIIDTKYYKKDYENTTEILLSKVVSYNDAISAIQKIIDSKVFEI